MTKSDSHLQELEDSGALEWRNNNWVEYNYVTPAGAFVDLGMEQDNVLDSNILDVLADVSGFIEGLEEYVQNHAGSMPKPTEEE